MLQRRLSLFFILALISIHIIIFHEKCSAQTTPELIWQPFPTPLNIERDVYGRIVNYLDAESNVFMHLYYAGQKKNEYDQYVRFTNIGADGYVDIKIRFHNGNNTIKEFVLNHYISSGECDTLVIGGKAQNSSTPIEYTMTFTSQNAVGTDSSGASFTIDSDYYKTITRATIKGEELNSFSDPKLIDDDRSAQLVHPADLDGDGDQDIISVLYENKSNSKNNDWIYWHENMDGKGTFGPKQFIDSTSTEFIHTVDLNGDGYVDLLTANNYDDTIFWYDNVDGECTFGTKKAVGNLDAPIQVLTADLDNDGDQDVITSNWPISDPHGEDHKIVWFENTDGVGTFDDPQLIVNGIPTVIFDVADLDGDGDTDLLSADYFYNIIYWCENTDGAGTFGPVESIPGLFITYQKENPTSVHAADLDGDNDLEILAGLGDGQKVIWYENTDGVGSFGEQQLFGLSTVSDWRIPVYAADFDNDGDMDVLSGSNCPPLGSGTTKLVWYKNIDGSAVFSEHTILTSRSRVKDIIPADLDGDGDADLLSAYSSDVVWFENLHGEVPTGIDILKQPPTRFQLKQNYPNPFNPITTIEFTVKHEGPVSLIVYDLSGREVETLVAQTMAPGQYKVQLNGQYIPSGIYLYQIKMDGYHEVCKMILLK